MNINSVHSVFIDRSSVSSAVRSTSWMTSPELTPGRKLPVIEVAVRPL